MSALGSLVVKLALEYAEYTQGLDKSSQEALKFAKNSQESFNKASASAKEFLGNVAGNVAGAIVSVVGLNAAFSRITESINILNILDDAAQKTGSSIEDLSRIEQVARNFGDAFNPIEQGITRLAKGLAEIDDPSSNAIRALDAIGVSARDSNGELRTAADVYIDVARSLQQYEDGTKKTAVAQALFGKSGAELLPMLNNLAQGIDHVNALSEENTRLAGEFNDGIALGKARVNNFFLSLSVDLLPTLNNIATAVNNSTGQISSFSVVSTAASAVLKGLAISGFTVVDTFRGMGREIGARAAQLAALASRDFSGAKFIGQSLAEDNIKSRAEYDKFVDTILNGEHKIAQAVAVGGTKKAIDFQVKLPVAVDAATKSIEKQTKAFDLEVVKLKQYESEAKRARDITASVATKQEAYNQTLEELERLRPYLSVEAYTRALDKAGRELQDVGTVNRQVTTEMDQLWIQAGRNIQSTFANSIFDFFNDGLDGMWRNAKSAVGRILSEFAALKISQSIGLSAMFAVPGTASASGIGGTGMNAFNIASLGSNAMSFMRGGFGIPAALSSVGGMLPGAAGSFFGAMGGTGAAAAEGASALWGASGLTGANAMGAAAGSAMAAAAGPLLAAFAATQLFKSFAGDKRLGGGFGKALNFVGDIPILGDFIPVVPLVNALFGRGPLKQKTTKLDATIGAEGFVSGALQTDFVAKGGLFRSDKNDFARIDAVTGAIETDNRKLNEFAAGLARVSKDVLGLISETTTQTSEGLRKIGTDLGLSVDGINNFSHTIELVSEKGKMLSDEQISEEIARITDGLARGLLPEVDNFAKRGENAVQTISRLGAEFSSLTQAAQNLGASVDYAKQLIGSLSIEARTAFLDNYGGTEKLLADSSSFSQLFLTEAERMAPAIKFVEDGLNSLGFSANITKDEFKQLVQTLLQSASESDQAKGVLLLQNNALFASVADYKSSIEEVAEKTEGLTAKTEDLTEAQQDYIDSVNRTIRAMQLDSAANQIALINQEIDKLVSFADSLKNTVEQISPQSLDSARQQVIEATQAARGGKVTDISAALATLSNQSTSGFTDSFSFARSKAQSVALIDQLSEAISGAIEFKQSSIADDLRIAANRSRIPAFASGGHHRGGLRIVGERGPEIERTGPSHITSNSDLKKSIGNDELLQELRKLNSTLDSVTQSGTALRTRNVA